jgi:hypothetical protein
MDILDLLEDLIIPGETYALEKLEYSGEETGFGDLEKEWTQIQALTGIIQEASEDPESPRGLEENADYVGFFHCNFEVPQENSGEYRIVNVISTTGGSFTRYFRIRKIDRNLVMDNGKVYIGMELQLAKKW